MGVFKLFEGTAYIKKLRLGLNNIKLFLAEKLLYQIPISGATATCSTATYNGSIQTAQNISVVLSGETLTNGTDYTVTSNSGGINAGTYPFTVSGINYFNSSVNGTLTINPKTVSSPTITLSQDTYTYNGSACQPTPTVKDGTTTIPSTEYTVSYNNNTNAGTATVTITDKSGGNYTVNGSTTFTINKVTPIVTAPTAKSLTYNGSAQALVNVGSTDWGTLQYSLNESGTYTTDVPSGTNATSYEVWYRVFGDSNINDVAAAKVTVSIAKANPTYTAPTAKNTTYNGEAQALLNAGSTSHGTIQYSSDNSTWSTTIPSATNANTYTSYWRLVGDSNHNNVNSTSISTTIAKASGSVSTKPTAKNLTYNGSAQALVNGGSGTGTMLYSLDNSTYGTAIPSGTNATTYTVYYKASASTNYNESTTGSVSVSIAKVTPTVAAPTAKSLTYNGSAQALVNGGSTNWGTLKYSLDNSTYSTAIPSGTNATSYTVYYRVDGNSNINDVAAKTVAVSIAKADTTYTAPTAKSLIYNTNAQALLNAGAVTGGTIQYSSDNTNWSTSIPTGTNANTYTSYWRIVGDSNHNDKASASISTTISAKTVSSPTITLSQDSYVYSNTAYQPTPTVKDGTVTISSSEYTVSYSNNTNVGTATCTITDKTGGNYVVSGSKNFTITKVTPTVTAPTPKTLTFNNANQVLANNGSTNWGTLQYCLNNSGGTYSTTVPSASAANTTYYVWYKVVGNGNINDVAPASIECMIAEKRVTTPTITLDPSSYTYSGSQCKPTPTVKDGTVVIPASEYTTTYSNNTNAGTATVTISDNTAGNYYISGTTTFTINKAAGSVSTAPTAKSLTYNGAAQQLVNAGSGTGTMMYKLDSGSWGTAIPTATNATSYTVYYKASASTNYNESASGSISVSIAKVTPTVTAPTAKSLTYNGSAQALVNAGSTDFGSLQYATAQTSTYSTSIPSGTNATSYEVWYKVVGDSNVNSTNPIKVACSIGKANPSYTAPTAKTGLTYNGSNQNLLNAGSTSHGTIQYSSDNSTWSTTIPQGKNANTYSVYWRLVGDSNHNNVNSTTISGISIAVLAGSISYGTTSVTKTYGNTAFTNTLTKTGDGAVSYSSNNTTVATVDSNGQVTIKQAGSATITATVANTSNTTYATKTASYTLTVNKANGSVSTAPTAKSLTWNGSAQALVNAGSGTGTIMYKLGSGSWGTAIPTATNATSYTVYYKASASTNYNESTSGSVACSIAKKTGCAISFATTSVSKTYGNAAFTNAATNTGDGSLTWTSNNTTVATVASNGQVTIKQAGSATISITTTSTTNCTYSTTAASYTLTVAKADQSAPTATGATVTYHNTATATASGGGEQGSIEWSDGSTRTATGTTTTKARWSGNVNYNASPYSNEVSLIVNKATDQSVTVTLTNRTYNTSGQVVASATSHGITNYYLGFGSSSTSAPTSWGSANSSISQTNAGTYYVWYKGTADANHSADISATYKGTVTISKADQSAPTATGATTTYNTTATATASGGGGQGSIEWSNSNTQTSVGSKTTKARWSGNGNYNPSSWSNEVTLTMNKANQNAPTATVTTATYPGTSTASASGGGGQGTLTWTNGSSRTAIGTQTTKAYWAGNGNYNASSYSNEVTLSVAKFTPTVTLAATNRAYNGNALYATASVATPSGGKTMKGTIYYGTSSGAQTYSVTYGGSGTVNLSSVSVTNVGSATVYAYFVPDSTCNDVYNNSGNASKTFTISKANQSAPTATGATVTYHNTATATASGGGGQGTLTWTNGSTRTATGSQDTYAYWSGNDNYNASPNSNKVTLTVNKATDQSVTVTLTNRNYNASGQVVASATSHGCTYYLGFGSSSTSAPTSWGSANSSISQTNAGTYYVWYKGTADANHSADISATYKGTVTINKIDPTITVPTAKTGLTYNGSSQTLYNAGSNTTPGSFSYTNGTRTNAGTQTVSWTFTPTDTTNYNTKNGSFDVTIAKAAMTYTAPKAATRNYTGSAQQIVSGQAANGGSIYYATSSAGASSSTTVPTQTNAGTYSTYWKAVPDSNHSGGTSSWAQITGCVINKIDPTITVPTAKTGLTYNGSSQTLYNAGSNTTAGSFSYTNGTGTYIDTYTVSWTFTPTDTTNYNTKSGSFTAYIITNFKPSGSDGLITSDSKYFASKP